ncbi:alpha/beta hydrolase [Streptomyces bathyalis]|uniref:Alpha/beta hydrolase n=1 Tax=Streptomyces bathyalis TaxID=2710756 RepID=A0A7T1WPV2_9ACTN|nr:alpha/beta hydrolase [Streptomyces bathyalis]QPP05453.1 alpha/beta hydrolase [Streptomyces bathyalis]
MATIVLVPGFWFGAWAWEEVTRDLREAGHDVHPVTLTGLADRAAEATAEVGLATHIADIVHVIEDGDLREVVLVGHSGANMPVTGAADRIPERLARIVYVDSGPMPDGLAGIDFHEPQAREQLRRQVAEEGEGWSIPVPAFDPDADPVNLAELSEAHLTRMRALGTPQPFGTAADPLDRPAVLPSTPRSVIMSTFTPEQVRMVAGTGNPVFELMAGMDMHHLPTGHWPMFSRPRELAAVLGEIAG